MTERVRRRLRVRGIVQGVGFRPFVYGTATRLGLAGFVLNDAEGVVIELEGEADAVAAFERELSERPPRLARVDEVSSEDAEPAGDGAFEIRSSETGTERRTLISPDVSTCPECFDEIADPDARRYRYPFTNCTNCGPRFTITRDVPYDRPNTTMASFPMCDACRAEYTDPADRRFHAQPIACPDCGPTLRLTGADGAAIPGDPIDEAARRLADGAVLAVKGLGGYHLACDAANPDAVAALRSRKHREEKPFALMAPDLEGVRRLCEVDDAEAELLEGIRRPVVLLRRHDDAPVAASVAPGNRFLGVMLPYTPLHRLLLDAAVAAGAPVVVMTSGNVSDEPIAYRDEDAYERLAPIADAFLTHDREVHIRCDDSVTRVRGGWEFPIRRARGYAPEPLRLARPLARPVLAVGAELKHVFAVAKDDLVFPSHHIGDLENWETMRSFTEGVEHFTRVFEIAPQVVAYDPHPEYLSTKWALEQTSEGDGPLAGLPTVAVQHHHAHIASCLADNEADGPVIGFALDGTGYGDDGTLWGFEVLVADLAGYERVGHLREVPLPGGAAAIREPWRMACVYLDAAFPDEDADLPFGCVRRNADRWDVVRDMARRGVNAPVASSAGRLFDAVAALCDLRDTVTYEGQAAIELEQAADPTSDATLPCPVDRGIVDGVALVRAVTDELRAGRAVPEVAAAFHNAVADVLVRLAERVRDERGLGTVALSGGTFQNLLLTDRVVGGLEARGFRVLTHHRVPANDGGIALGQAVVAGYRT